MLHGTHSPRLTRIQHLGIHPGRFTAGTWEYTPWKRKSIWTKPSWLQVRLLNLPGVYTSCFIRIPTMGYNKPYNKGYNPLYDLNNQGCLHCLHGSLHLYFQTQFWVHLHKTFCWGTFRCGVDQKSLKSIITWKCLHHFANHFQRFIGERIGH